MTQKNDFLSSGTIVERDEAERLFENPSEKYANELTRSIPIISDEEEKIKP